MKLVAFLPAPDFDALVTQLSKSTEPLGKDHCMVRVLRRWPHKWSETVTKIWLDLLANHIANHADQEKVDSTLVTAMRQCARACPPHMAHIAKTSLGPRVKPGTIYWTPVQGDDFDSYLSP